MDAINILNKVMPENIEFHMNCKGSDGTVSKCNFLGPNTNLRKRLVDYDSKTGFHSGINTPPINWLDELAYHHDIAYHGNLQEKHRADEEMIRKINERLESGQTDSHTRMQALIARAILGLKLKLGLGHK